MIIGKIGDILNRNKAREFSAESRKNLILSFVSGTIATTTFAAVGANIVNMPPNIYASLVKSEIFVPALLLGGWTSGFALGTFIINKMPNLRRRRFALKNEPENSD